MNVEFKRMDLDDWLWFNKRLSVFKVEDTAGYSMYDGDEIVAAWVFDNYTGTSVQCHLVIEKSRALRNGLIETIAGIAFEVLGCYAIYALVPSNKEKALRLNAHIGFTEKCRMENAFALGVDSVLLELTPEKCKYYEQRKAA